MSSSSTPLKSSSFQESPSSQQSSSSSEQSSLSEQSAHDQKLQEQQHILQHTTQSSQDQLQQRQQQEHQSNSNNYRLFIWMCFTYQWDCVISLHSNDYKKAILHLRKVLHLLNHETGIGESLSSSLSSLVASSLSSSSSTMIATTTSHTTNNNLDITVRPMTSCCPSDLEIEKNIYYKMFCSIRDQLSSTSSFMICGIPIDDSSNKQCHQIVPMSPHNSFVLYDRIFVLDPIMMMQYPQQLSSSLSSSGFIRILSVCVLLFNMGVTYHRYGLSALGASKSSIMLMKAHTVYKLAIDVLTNVPVATKTNDNTNHQSDSSDTPHHNEYHRNDSSTSETLDNINNNNNQNNITSLHPQSQSLQQQQQNDFAGQQLHDEKQIDMIMLQLALWNNIGHICSHRFMYHEMEQCLEELSQLIRNNEQVRDILTKSQQQQQNQNNNNHSNSYNTTSVTTETTNTTSDHPFYQSLLSTHDDLVLNVFYTTYCRRFHKIASAA